MECDGICYSGSSSCILVTQVSGSAHSLMLASPLINTASEDSDADLKVAPSGPPKAQRVSAQHSLLCLGRLCD